MRRLYPFAASAAALLIASTSFAQFTAPQKDSTKPQPKKDSTRWELTTLKMTPLTEYQLRDLAGIDSNEQFRGAHALPDSFYSKQETHLQNIRQLTFAGENAEAYLNPDNTMVSFQARGTRIQSCDQIFMMRLDGTNIKRISTGLGHTTCSYFLPSGNQILFASTHLQYGGICPPDPDRSKGYVWPLYKGYDIYVADTNGRVIKRLTNDSTYYDAEATVSPVGDKIIFTSTRDGDVELYSMNIDGSNVKRLTNEVGYDGGAFFSPNGKQIIYRASRPTGDELKEYKDLLKDGLIRPHKLELFIMNADGSGKRQLTHLNAASFAPYWYPDGKHIIFSSNVGDPAGRDFDLYMIGTDGTGLERITYSKGFDGFPVFTKDGKHLIFCSNRNGSSPNNTNIFIADWSH